MKQLSPGTSLRRLLNSDAPAYRHLMLEALALEPEAFTSSHAERRTKTMDWWETRLETPAPSANQVWGVFLDAQLVGCAGLVFEDRERVCHKACLFGMYVQAAARGKGIGSALLSELLAVARALPGVTLVQLTVSAGNDAAETLYARHGFQRFGTEPMAVRHGNRYVAKIHMWCPLA